MKLVWTRRATRHLQAAHEYWAHERSEDAADIMLERIFSGIEVLEHHPALGRHGRIAGTRELALVPLPFILVYRVKRNRIETIALIRGACKWPDRF